MKLLPTLAALAIASICAPALSQTSTTTTTDPGTAATTTGTTTSQQEMNRGVPGVDVDVGRNARGAVDVDVDRNTSARNAPGARATRDDMATTSRDTARAPRADRN